jgi:hypothetical protein
MTYCARSELSGPSPGRLSGALFCWLIAILSGCKGTEVSEGAAYRSCSRAEPPASWSGTSGHAAFNLLRRTLTLTPTAAAVRVAVFSGSGLTAPDSSALEQLRATQADVFVVLGGLGRSNAQAIEVVRALETLQRLVLVVRGGADGFEFDKGRDSTVLDASGLRLVRIGDDSLLPWPGAEQGRYALDPGRCGFGEPELAAAVEELGPKQPRERRWLLSWQAPAPGSSLAELVAKAGVSGVLSAWPALPQPTTDAWDPVQPLLVPRGWEPGLEGLDGAALPTGTLRLRFDKDGLHRER